MMHDYTAELNCHPQAVNAETLSGREGARRHITTTIYPRRRKLYVHNFAVCNNTVWTS